MGRTPTHLASRAAGADEEKQQATTFWVCDLRKLMLGGARWRGKKQRMTGFHAKWWVKEQVMWGWALASIIMFSTWASLQACHINRERCATDNSLPKVWNLTTSKTEAKKINRRIVRVLCWFKVFLNHSIPYPLATKKDWYRTRGMISC